MQITNEPIYVCPYSKKPLQLIPQETNGLHLITGMLKSKEGITYDIKNGIPFLINAENENFAEVEQKEFEHYQSSSDSYDDVVNWIFNSFYEDESLVRNNMIDLLKLKPTDKVLETGCGTCQDSLFIAKRLEKNGQLFMQDLSPNMLMIGRDKMQKATPSCELNFFVGNAANLPFPDGYFDAAYHFGGINLFTDKKKAIAEMCRVVRVGGKIVFGDESTAPWLKNTLYGNILENSNKLFKHSAPIDLLPESARNVCIRWFLGNAYYLIDFEVGEGVPQVNLDLPILGKRGGTHRTRFYGTLENVSLKTKEIAYQAAELAGVSMHEWLDNAVREAAIETIKKNN